MKKTLKQLAKNEITPTEAFNLIYGRRDMAARFVSLRIYLRESPVISVLINGLFILPIPIVFGKLFIRKILEKKNLDIRLFNEYQSTLGGTNIVVNSEDADIYIKLF